MKPLAAISLLRATATQLRAQADALDAQAALLESAPDESGATLIGPGDVGVDRATWRRAIRSGELRGVLVGREYRAARADVAAWLESRRAAVRPLADRSDSEQPADEMDRVLRRVRKGLPPR